MDSPDRHQGEIPPIHIWRAALSGDAMVFQAGDPCGGFHNDPADCEMYELGEVQSAENRRENAPESAISRGIFIFLWDSVNIFDFSCGTGLTFAKRCAILIGETQKKGLMQN